MNPSDLPPVDMTNYTADPPRKRRNHLVLAAIGIIVTLVLGTIVYIISSLGPVNPSSQEQVRFVVRSGQTATEIAQELHDLGLIHDPIIFQLYTRFTGTKSSLRAGGYVLKPSDSLSEIVSHLTSGKTDEVAVTILPGFTLEQLSDPDFDGSLAQQGFSREEISYALSATYRSPLLSGKPIGGSLEGYIYPETYNIMANDSLETVLQMSFDEMYKQIQRKGIESRLQQQGLSLREGIILASIVQKEVSNVDDQRQVAQVFLKRLREDIVLGSDVTFMYIAEKEGRAPSVNDDSPYNTRKFGGLPPGPIANFNLSALEAVANPAEGDYLYFVAGDDGTTYFSMTEEEHIEKTRLYCTTLCQ